MIIEDDPDLLVSEDEEITNTHLPRGTAYRDDSTSDEDEPIARISDRNQLKSETRMDKLDDSGLTLSEIETDASYHHPVGVQLSTKRKREATPEHTENATLAKDLSIFDVECTPSPPHKVKRGRDRLLDVEHAPNHLKTVSRQNQRSAPFLSLPWDIKLKIYKLAIGGQHIHIQYQPHIHSWRQKNNQRFKEHIPGGLHCQRNDDGETEDEGVVVRRVRLGLPIISTTCRQIYHDTALLYYSLNKFSFDNTWVMKKWLKSLAPVRRRALTCIVIPPPWHLPKYIMNDLKGLRTVYLMFPSKPSTSRTEWMRHCSDLWTGRGISVIYYHLKWGSCDVKEARRRFR